jgi:hypothetical protein
MIGLIILVIGIIYLAGLVVVSRSAYRWTKNKGLSKTKCWLAATVIFLAIYLPVFWDHIPTLIAHRYYCASEAGLWIYKTPEQWKKENPRVAETLTYSGSSRSRVDPESKTRVTYLNERFESRSSNNSLRFIPVTIFTHTLVDQKTGDVLAKHVSAGAGYGNMMVGNDWRSMKFWLSLGSCEGEKFKLYGQYESIRWEYAKLGSK